MLLLFDRKSGKQVETQGDFFSYRLDWIKCLVFHVTVVINCYFFKYFWGLNSIHHNDWIFYHKRFHYTFFIVFEIRCIFSCTWIISFLQKQGKMMTNMYLSRLEKNRRFYSMDNTWNTSNSEKKIRFVHN